jgi:hypothetical protein
MSRESAALVNQGGLDLKGFPDFCKMMRDAVSDLIHRRRPNESHFRPTKSRNSSTLPPQS